jgi:hypothetical protein
LRLKTAISDAVDTSNSVVVHGGDYAVQLCHPRLGLCPPGLAIVPRGSCPTISILIRRGVLLKLSKSPIPHDAAALADGPRQSAAGPFQAAAVHSPIATLVRHRERRSHAFLSR